MKWLKLAPEPDAIRLARSDCGALYIEVAGERVGLRPSGALWSPSRGLLVAGDLHLEKGSSFAARGQLLPPFDTAETLLRLEAEVDRLQPDLLVLIGDSFHDRRALSRLAPKDAERIAALARRVEIVWVAGNHDRRAPIESALPGEVAEEVRIGPLTLRHEPAVGPALGEIAGHLHPCAKVVGKGGRVRRRAFATDGLRLILPAFGAFAGGLNLCDPAFAGLFRVPPLAGVLGADAVHPIPFRDLCGDRPGQGGRG